MGVVDDEVLAGLDDEAAEGVEVDPDLDVVVGGGDEGEGEAGRLGEVVGKGDVEDLLATRGLHEFFGVAHGAANRLGEAAACLPHELFHREEEVRIEGVDSRSTDLEFGTLDEGESDALGPVGVVEAGKGSVEALHVDGELCHFVLGFFPVVAALGEGSLLAVDRGIGVSILDERKDGLDVGLGDGVRFDGWVVLGLLGGSVVAVSIGDGADGEARQNDAEVHPIKQITLTVQGYLCLVSERNCGREGLVDGLECEDGVLLVGGAEEGPRRIRGEDLVHLADGEELDERASRRRSLSECVRHGIGSRVFSFDVVDRPRMTFPRGLVYTL